MNKRGFSLVELMISVTIMAIIVPIIGLVFITATRAFITFEAMSTLKKVNQNSVNRIYVRLNRNKRLFEETLSDLDFLNAVNLSGCPSVLSGSKLPVIKQTGSLSPSSDDFDASAFGNSLFLVYKYLLLFIVCSFRKSVNDKKSGVMPSSNWYGAIPSVICL